MNFVIGNSIKGYYKVKYFIKKPDPQMVNGLYPTTYKQEQLLSVGYNELLAKGHSKRDARRIIERKLRIKIIPEGK